ncbi:hypothetical protein CYMTET_44734 [Cymbomonas tetramitiformis]|uniref:Epidermal growth factor receptor substrate 15 n=1 Tax=Cymbomonas tetramitiformis TaxID=36881 RepID=A0AAE0C0U9_9CHLO|nr:hypothetical protein CYMTET_44734 [Cymbomonas tetramitiformis]
MDSFEQWFREADTDGDGKISGVEAVRFYQRSKLDKVTLRKIWDLSDTASIGVLTKEQFIASLRLVALAQNGGQLSSEVAKIFLGGGGPKQIPLILNPDGSHPVAKSVPQPALHPMPPQPAAQPVAQPGVWPSLSEAELAKYAALFRQTDTDGDGLVTGAEAVGILSKFGLKKEVLKAVWDLADTNSSGSLNEKEFVLSLYLVVRPPASSLQLRRRPHRTVFSEAPVRAAQAREGREMPACLPPGEFPPLPEAPSPTVSRPPPAPTPSSGGAGFSGGWGTNFMPSSAPVASPSSGPPSFGSVGSTSVTPASGYGADLGGTAGLASVHSFTASGGAAPPTASSTTSTAIVDADGFGTDFSAGGGGSASGFGTDFSAGGGGSTSGFGTDFSAGGGGSTSGFGADFSAGGGGSASGFGTDFSAGGGGSASGFGTDFSAGGGGANSAPLQGFGTAGGPSLGNAGAFTSKPEPYNQSSFTGLASGGGAGGMWTAQGARAGAAAVAQGTSGVPSLETGLKQQLSSMEAERITTLTQECAGMENDLQKQEEQVMSESQKVRMYNAKMQELVLFKSRCSSQMMQMNEKALRAKREADEAEQMYQTRATELQQMEASLQNQTQEVEVMEAAKQELHEKLQGLESREVEIAANATVNKEVFDADMARLRQAVLEAEARLATRVQEAEQQVLMKKEMQDKLDEYRISEAAAESELNRDKAQVQQLCLQLQALTPGPHGTAAILAQLGELVTPASAMFHAITERALAAGIPVQMNPHLLAALQQSSGILPGSPADWLELEDAGFVMVEQSSAAPGQRIITKTPRPSFNDGLHCGSSLPQEICSTSGFATIATSTAAADPPSHHKPRAAASPLAATFSTDSALLENLGTGPPSFSSTTSLEFPTSGFPANGDDLAGLSAGPPSFGTADGFGGSGGFGMTFFNSHAGQGSAPAVPHSTSSPLGASSNTAPSPAPDTFEEPFNPFRETASTPSDVAFEAPNPPKVYDFANFGPPTSQGMDAGLGASAGPTFSVSPPSGTPSGGETTFNPFLLAGEATDAAPPATTTSPGEPASTGAALVPVDDLAGWVAFG